MIYLGVPKSAPMKTMLRVLLCHPPARGSNDPALDGVWGVL